MLLAYIVAHIAGGACLAAAGLQAVERREIGPVAPMVSAAALAIVGLGLALAGHFAT